MRTEDQVLNDYHRYKQFRYFLLEDSIWIAAQNIGLPIYDFDFHTYFACRHPWERPEKITAVGRFGVTTNYSQLYYQLVEQGGYLIHNPDEYLKASELPYWYSLIEDLTPKSRWYKEPPSIAEVENNFNWPIFIKGSRQTNKYKESLSIIRSPEEFDNVMQIYRQDPILHWQEIVIRDYMPLRKVAAPNTEKIPPAFEFRTFWWRGDRHRM